jgi:hypothetical protein
MIQSSIKYERESQDFAVVVDDQIVGWRGTHTEAEALLNETVTRLLERRAAVARRAYREALAAQGVAEDALRDAA